MKMTYRYLTLALALITLAPTVTRADDLPHHHLALFAGLGTESKPGHGDENGFAIGYAF